MLMRCKESNQQQYFRAVKLDGIVLSTDDYFTKGDLYEYDPDKLTEAHQWNRERGNRVHTDLKNTGI